MHPAAARNRSMYLFMPAGLFSIAAAVEHAGARAALVNEGLEIALDPAYQAAADPLVASADLVGVSLHWHEHAYGAVTAVRAVREANPEAVLVMGGLTASVFASELASAVPEVDAVLVGEAEEAMAALVHHLAPIPRSRRRQAVASLVGRDRVVAPCRLVLQPGALGSPLVSATLPRLAHHTEYLKCDIHTFVPERFWRSFWVKTGVGCPYACSFCGGGRKALQAAGFAGRVQFRPAAELATDIAALAEAGVHQVNLTQDLTLAPVGYMQELRSSLRARRVRVGAYMEAWQCPNPHWLETFADTFDIGFSCIALSPTSGDESVRRRNGKHFSDAALLETAAALGSLGIRWEAFFTAGLPFATDASFERTVALAERLMNGYSPTVVTFSGITLDPMAPMAGDPEKYDVTAGLRTFADYYQRAEARSRGEPYARMGYETRGADPDTVRRQEARWAAGPGRVPIWQNGLLGLTPHLAVLRTGGDWT